MARRAVVDRVLVGAALLVALVFMTARVQAYRDRPYLHSNLYLPSGKFVKETSAGYNEIAGDIVWFQAVQYYGGYRQNEHDLAYFAGLIDIVNELDPHFMFPYIFGAIVMAQDMGNLNRGVGVLKRGMQNNPEDWQYPFEIGFLYYTVTGVADEAAQYFDLASRLPGGGDRARRFAAWVYSKAGHRETSIRMWEELARDSDEPYMKELARRYIDRLKRGESITGRRPRHDAPVGPAQEARRHDG